jgi:hypothetical protein
MGCIGYDNTCFNLLLRYTDMIMTPIGCLEIKIDDIPYLYEYLPLPTQFGNFSVLQRYQIIIPIQKRRRALVILHYQCDDVSEGINSGENLYAISFTKNNLDIKIGMEGDIEGINYLKIKNGCCLVISSVCQQSHLKINIAWKYKEDDFDVSVWFAVDPTINT